MSKGNNKPKKQAKKAKGTNAKTKKQEEAAPEVAPRPSKRGR